MQKQRQMEATNVTEFFDGKRISKIRKISQNKIQTPVEIQSSQRQEFVCDVLEGCDDIQVTENEVLCITKEENKSHNSKNRCKEYHCQHPDTRGEG